MITKGFTLIELLIVIAILAVLSTMGFATFRGVVGRGNDARRLEDLKAIADALEANRVNVGGVYGYAQLSDQMFSSGSIPKDPSSIKTYCISSDSTGTNGAKPSAWSGLSCPGAISGVGANGQAFAPVSSSTPNASGATTIWMICALMEDDIIVNCRSSSQ